MPIEFTCAQWQQALPAILCGLGCAAAIAFLVAALSAA